MLSPGISRFFAACLLVAGMPQVVLSAEQADLAFVISRPSRLIPLRSGIVGFNSELGATSGAQGNYQSAVITQGIQRLPAMALRYPGGTLANFFDWERQRLSAGRVRTAGHNKLLSSIQRDIKRNGGTQTHPDLGSFVGLTRNIGADRYLVLNLLTDDVEQSIKNVDRVKMQYPESMHWELGNELSLHTYGSRFDVPGGWNERIYAAKAGRIAQHIHDNYPEDRVGIVVSDLASGRIPNTRGSIKAKYRRSKWDAAVASIREVDSVTIHPYLFLSSKVYNQLHRLDLPEPGLLPGGGDAERTWRWLFACIQKVPQEYMERLEGRFPGKTVWITETGITSDDSEKQFVLEDQTAFRALADAAYFISWLRYYPKVEVQLFHGLFWGNGWASALYRDYSYTANGVAYAFIKAALEKAQAVAWLDLSALGGYQGIGLYSGTKVHAVSGLYIATAQGGKVLLVNSGNRDVLLKPPFEGSRRLIFQGRENLEIGQGSLKGLDDFHLEVGGSVISLPAFSMMLVSEEKPA